MIFSSTFEPADGEDPAQCTAFYTNMVSLTCNENILSAPLETRTKVSVNFMVISMWMEILTRRILPILLPEEENFHEFHALNCSYL